MVMNTLAQSAAPRTKAWSTLVLPVVCFGQGTGASKIAVAVELPTYLPPTQVPAFAAGVDADMRIRNAKLDSPPRREPR
jgi:hypothetical protein